MNNNFINKPLFAIGKDGNSVKCRFYGGIPKNLTKNLKKCTFREEFQGFNDFNIGLHIKEMNYVFNNGNQLNVPLNSMKGKTSIFRLLENQKGMFGLPKSNIDNFCKQYQNNIKNENVNGNDNNSYIYFKIGNKNFKYNYSGNPCELFTVSNKFTFGNIFTDLFSFIEFNIQTKEFSLYFDKEKNYFSDEEVINKKEEKIINCNNDIALFSLLVVLCLFQFTKNYNILNNYLNSYNINNFDYINY